MTDKQVQPRISLIAALDTEGKIWFSLTQANTDSDVMCLFLRKLMAQLDRERPGWQEDTTILLDNAAWHTNPVMKQRLARMQLHVIFSGPYSYSTAPIVSKCQLLSLSGCVRASFWPPSRYSHSTTYSPILLISRSSYLALSSSES